VRPLSMNDTLNREVLVAGSRLSWIGSDGVYSLSTQYPLLSGTNYAFPFHTGDRWLANNGQTLAWISNFSTVTSYVLGVATDVATDTQPSSVVVDGTDVYWRNAAGELRSVPIGGGTVTTLTSGQDAGPYTRALVQSGARLYWTNPTAGTIATMVKGSDAGAPQTLFSGETNPGTLATDGTNLYWTGSGGIRKGAIGGGTAVTIATNVVVAALASDGTNVYFVDLPNGVSRVPVGGGNVSVLVDAVTYGQYDSYGIAVDGTSVYWTLYNTGLVPSVLSVTPK